MKAKWMIDQDRALIPQSELNSWIQPTISWLQKRWQDWLGVLARQSEPTIWQSVDRKGNHWWNVYHPATGESATLESEQEVRIWLEQSYYR